MKPSQIDIRDRWTAALFCLAAALAAAAPWLGAPRFTITLLTEGMIFAIWAMSLDLLVGYAGLVTFGHAAGFGLGGYVAGWIACEVSDDFLVALAVAEAVVIAVAVATGFVATRVSGVAFAIFSLCVAQVLFQIAVGWRSVTQGMDGLLGVPLPKLFGMTVRTGTPFYLLTLASLVVTFYVLMRLVRSPYGRTLHAIRTSEDRAAAVGINVRLNKWIAFVVSWAFAGLGGTLMVFMKAGTTPMSLHWSESGNVLVMAIFGGIGTLLGPIIGAVAFVVLRDELTTYFKAWQLAFGFVFVVVVLAFPSGLAGVFGRMWNSLWRTR